MKKKLLITLTTIFIILLINGCIEEKNKELIKENIPKIENKSKNEPKNKSKNKSDNKPENNNKIVKTTKKKTEKDKIKELYYKLGLNGKLQYKIFQMAMKGLEILNPTKRNYLAIVDFTQDSSKKRFFMIDLINETIIYNDLVAHGMNSGETKAKYFSNDDNSHKSSLGFYSTAETYYGSNGYSLRLEGLDPGLNDNARIRDIVLHGASYVNENNISKTGRIGRSWGCPAVSPKINKDVIDKLKGGNILFQYAKEYDKKTSVLKGIVLK